MTVVNIRAILSSRGRYLETLFGFTAISLMAIE